MKKARRTSTSTISRIVLRIPIRPDLAAALRLESLFGEIAIGSPAIAAFRASSAFEAPDVSYRMMFAFEVATEFLSMFNKPEAIELLD